jgi:hypothetical protein
MAPNLQVFCERNTLSLILPILARFPSVQSEGNSDYSWRSREKIGLQLARKLEL